MHTIEVIPEAASGARQTGSTMEGELELADVTGEDELVELGEVFMLAYQQPVPHDFDSVLCRSWWWSVRET